jgi:hypothetical protein
MKDGQHECGGLAGARLCRSLHIAGRENFRYCPRLNRRGFLVTGFGDTAHERLDQPKGCESGFMYQSKLQRRPVAWSSRDTNRADERLD